MRNKLIYFTFMFWLFIATIIALIAVKSSKPYDLVFAMPDYLPGQRIEDLKNFSCDFDYYSYPVLFCENLASANIFSYDVNTRIIEYASIKMSHTDLTFGDIVAKWGDPDYIVTSYPLVFAGVWHGNIAVYVYEPIYEFSKDTKVYRITINKTNYKEFYHTVAWHGFKRTYE